jgi:hypothetical protein
MKALAGRIPRAFKNHKTPEGAAYRDYVRALLRRLGGSLPDDARVTLREAGRLAVELQSMGRDLEAARARRRRRDVHRLRRAMVPARTQLIRLEERLEQLAAASRSSSVRLAEFLKPTGTGETR